MDNATADRLVTVVLDKRPTVVLIAGPGCVGKSYFATQIAERLDQRGLLATDFGLDGFLFDRAIRLNRGWITAHNPLAYDLARAAEILRTLVAKRVSQAIPLLDKKLSRSVGYRLIEPAECYLIEGTVAFHLSVENIPTLRVFIDADRETQFNNRYARERIEVGYTRKESIARFESYWRDYLQYLVPDRERADLLIDVDHEYRGRISCPNEEADTPHLEED